MKTLERRLELTGVIGISVSAMLGSGIFVLPGIAASHTGSTLWLAYIVASICVLPAALAKSELATAMPSSGGTYLYIDRTFGPLAGTISGIGLWLSLLLKSCFALVGLSVYLKLLVDLPVIPVALLFLTAVIAVNIRGVRGVGQVQIASVIITLTTLFILTLWGFFDESAHPVQNTLAHGRTGLFSAVGLVFVSYAGVTKIAAIAEEIRKPERNLPLAILLSLLIITVVYASVAVVLVRCVDMDVLARPDVHPIYSLAHALGGKIPGIVVSIVGVITMASMANAGLLAASRFPFAMSRDGLLPEGLHKLHERFLTPTSCILASGVLMAVAICTLEIEGIAKLASAFKIMMFMATNASVVVLRETGVRWYKPSFRSPFYPWIQIFGLVSGLVLLFAMGLFAFLALAGITAGGTLLFVLYGRHRTKRQGVVGQRGRRKSLIRDSLRPTPMAELSGPESVPPLSGMLSEVTLTGSARVVVVLFGDERSPEMQVELAAALAEGDRVEVIHLTEVPEQTIIDQALAEDPAVSSVRRRLMAMSRRQGFTIDFEDIASHDIIQSVHEATSRLRCEWLVMEQKSRRRDAFTFKNPLGWLRDHVSANLAIFDDAGVRSIEEILVRVVPGSHDTLVAGTADHLAQLRNARLSFVQYIPEGQPDSERHANRSYLESFCALCSSPSTIVEVSGKTEAKAIARVSAGFDLLVTHEDPVRSIRNRIFGSRADEINERAACSVLRVQSPPGRTHEALDWFGSQPKSDAKGLLSYVQDECVAVRLGKRKKDALFAHFAEAFATVLPDIGTERIISALMQREREQNTSVGLGLALPHATVGDSDETYLGIFTTEKPVDYDAPDGVGVDVFFVTLGSATDRQTHLQILSTISKLVRETPILEELRKAATPSEALASLRACSARLSA